MKILIISNIGPREVPLKDGDSIQDVMASKELAGFQVVLPVCTDRQLKEPLLENISLQKQGLEDNSTIYCKFKLKDEKKTDMVAGSLLFSSENKSSGIAESKIKKVSSSKTGKHRPTNKHEHSVSPKSLDVLSPMHIKPTVIIRKRSSIPSVDKLLFSPPPPNKNNDGREIVQTSIPKLPMRQCVGNDDGVDAEDTTTLSPLRMKSIPMLRKRSQSQSSDIDDSLFSPTGKLGQHNTKARLEIPLTPPSV